ncbi:hypothetical protein DIE23_10825 [Burkholderia sp. Bp9143]|uniref:hypothetical protein n=1 Tax=Burkholderia sp. Bp9143 TaxID=2184574 RepID=UPI000F5A5846|nr:hypothetical protein [Burkholderia sp. Bp9143]RQR35043.1 hypothetical protein DIE23_10825 [Burkholderia sp. Bp9143]
MTRGRHTGPRTPLRFWLGGIGFCLLLASATTWLGAIHDHPSSAGVVAGMTAPECGRVSARPAGSLLTAPLPDHDICLPLFLYRASYPDAASDVASYRTWILQQRVGEFWRLFGYVLLLWATILLLVAGSFLFIRHRHRGSGPGTSGDRRNGGNA